MKFRYDSAWAYEKIEIRSYLTELLKNKNNITSLFGLLSTISYMPAYISVRDCCYFWRDMSYALHAYVASMTSVCPSVRL